MGRRRPYHHGDLRRALVLAGMEVLQERGLEAVTLRETARRTGVSHAAPYHHFPDKAHLIEAIAIEGFGRFADALQAAWDDTPGPSLVRFRAVGLTYVRFALERPAQFRLMHRPELRGGDGARDDEALPPVVVAGRRAYEVLLRSIGTCQQDGFIHAGDPEPLALTAWSSVHGLAVLLLEGLLEEGAVGVERGVDLATAVTNTLGRGLVVPSRLP
jgi:AcrR family transcriptional regulator